MSPYTGIAREPQLSEWLSSVPEPHDILDPERYDETRSDRAAPTETQVTYATYGRLGAKPGHRDELVAILIRPSAELSDVGCLLYEVGVAEDDPDGVHLIELWTSPEAHRASLELASVKSSISEAMPLLDGAPTGGAFDVSGSPIGK
jgi:quinol monooxygenase YgiN